MTLLTAVAERRSQLITVDEYAVFTRYLSVCMSVSRITLKKYGCILVKLFCFRGGAVWMQCVTSQSFALVLTTYQEQPRDRKHK